MSHTSRPQLSDFASAICSFQGEKFLDNEHIRKLLLIGQERQRSGKLVEIFYSPFEHIEQTARIVIVGITPGKTQAENALRAARAALMKGDGYQSAARAAKLAASFSGPMRANLCSMLNSAGVPEWLGIRDSSDLFNTASSKVHFTSALRNPVFVDGKNYNGQPPILSRSVFIEAIDTALAEEVLALPHAWWLPLWDVPAAALRRLVDRHILAPDKLLAPMPHPSGGNGENIAWFKGTSKAQSFSSRRASTGDILLKRRESPPVILLLKTPRSCVELASSPPSGGLDARLQAFRTP